MSTGWANSTRRDRLPRDWARTRARILHRDPNCQACGLNAAVDVDHIQSGDNHDDTNLQGLCRHCHQTKTINERPTRQRPPGNAHPNPIPASSKPATDTATPDVVGPHCGARSPHNTGGPRSASSASPSPSKQATPPPPSPPGKLSAASPPASPSTAHTPNSASTASNPTTTTSNTPTLSKATPTPTTLRELVRPETRHRPRRTHHRSRPNRRTPRRRTALHRHQVRGPPRQPHRVRATHPPRPHRRRVAHRPTPHGSLTPAAPAHT